MSDLRNLLWVDCTAGAVVGVAVLLLSGWLADLYALPHGLVLVTGAANLLYAAYSCSLAVRPRRTMPWIVALAVANMAWGGVCVGLLVAFGGTASAFGIAHLAAEAVFVGGLGAVEWRVRDRLL